MTLGFEKVQKRGPNVVNASHNFPSRHPTCRLELCWQIYRQPWPQRQVACGMDCRGRAFGAKIFWNETENNLR